MSSLQKNWDARAAANFMLGGTGAGLMIAAAIVGPEAPYAAMLSLVLIAAGLAAVWLETGRKLRALHVLFNPMTSWMTRESFAALLLFPLGLGAILTSKFIFAAALAAAAFLYCQARILRAAKGIPAWRAPELVPLVVTTGLAEGAGACLLFVNDPLALALFAAAVIARALTWSRYRRAAPNPALELAGKALLQIGTVAALALLITGYGFPEISLFTSSVAGVLAIATGWWLKFTLVTRAAFNQGFALPRLPVRGTR